MISDMDEFFAIHSRGPTGPIFVDIDFNEDDIVQACSELSNGSAPGPDGVPADLLKRCRWELKRPLYLLWRESVLPKFPENVA